MESRVLVWPAFVLTAAVAQPALSVDCDGTVPIFEIQGRGHISPYVGETVETCGVVTAVGFRTYYLQDPVGDGDPATSDGINVFDRRFDEIPAVGTLVRLRDRVDEFIPGGADTGNLSTTQFAFPTILERETGVGLPDPVVIGRSGRLPPARDVISPTEIEPPINLQDPSDAAANPFNPEQDGIDFYESLEGMLVTIEDPVAVSAIRQFGTFSAEFFTLTNKGRFAKPRKALTRRDGIALQPDPDNRGDQNPERIQVQLGFDSNTDYPPVTLGDRLTDVTGVVGYSFGNYEVNAVTPIEIRRGRNLPQQTRNRSSRYLTVASYNVLNLSAVDNDNAQREKIADQIAKNLRSPDIIALQEIQDNNGDEGDCGSDKSPCSNVLAADQTLIRLADAIVAAGGDQYDYCTVDPLQETTQTDADGPDVFGGVPLGNIRNAFLYNPDRVRLLECIGLTREVLQGRGVGPSDAFDFSRDALEGVFEFKGERITILNNHFTSRFGSTPVFGGPQPFEQAGEAAREAQAQAMHEVVQYHLDHDEDANIIVLGDLNTFEFTNDLAEILPGTDRSRVLRNLIRKARRGEAYSFVFEGNSQALDHIFVTDDLYPKGKVQYVHVNVDFPRRFADVTGSDHEPVLASFRFDRRLRRWPH